MLHSWRGCVLTIGEIYFYKGDDLSHGGISMGAGRIHRPGNMSQIRCRDDRGKTAAEVGSRDGVSHAVNWTISHSHLLISRYLRRKLYGADNKIACGLIEADFHANVPFGHFDG